jgi:hypothetical protein
MTEQRKYHRSASSRIRAFFLTDRVGQTLASTLGVYSIAKWWSKRLLLQLRRR